MLNTEKTGHRVPQKMQTELRALEKPLACNSRAGVGVANSSSQMIAFTAASLGETAEDQGLSRERFVP